MGEAHAFAGTRRRPRGLGAVVALGLAGLAPAAVEAWPAVQDPSTGVVYLCDSRPDLLASGQWTCRSGGGTLVGTLVEVTRPGEPPGARPWGGPPGPSSRYRYGAHPWGPPPREPSGYDALDPWLGHGVSER